MKPGLRYYLLALLLCLIWGMNFVAMKVAIWGVGPYNVAWLRQSLAGLSVLLYLKLAFKDVSLSPASWLLLLINGLIYSLSNVALSIGLDLTTASRAVVIVYTQPLIVAILAHFMLKGERLAVLKLLGVVLAFSGVVLVFSERLGGGALRGDLFALACAIFWGIQTIYVKHYLSLENPYVVTAWQGLAG
ncbi:MAG: DMT family transporter, partial [Nitrospinota bacterium]